MIPFTQNFRKCKVTYRDKEVGQWQPEEGMGDGEKPWGGKTFKGYAFAYYLECNDAFTGINRYQNLANSL